MKQRFHLTNLFLLCILVGVGCSPQLKMNGFVKQNFYVGHDAKDTIIEQYSPAFLIHEHQVPHNRIGKPEAKIDEKGDTKIYVNPDKPVMFFEKRNFKTLKGEYTNLIYRVHFQKVPFRMIPFYLTAGKNVGILVIITLDSKNNPILITTVGTCGCYAATVPTTQLPEDAFPDAWEINQPLIKYGEQLPPVIDYNTTANPRLLITIRPDVHRVMNISIIDNDKIKETDNHIGIQAPLMPIQYLNKIPVNGTVVSFYHEDGLLEGFVKGAVKPWETLLMSWISLDLFVGTDKIYGPAEKGNNRFYTSLKPWNRNTSDLNRFTNFLQYWGWKL